MKPGWPIVTQNALEPTKLNIQNILPGHVLPCGENGRVLKEP